MVYFVTHQLYHVVVVLVVVIILRKWTQMFPLEKEGGAQWFVPLAGGSLTPHGDSLSGAELDDP